MVWSERSRRSSAISGTSPLAMRFNACYRYLIRFNQRLRVATVSSPLLTLRFQQTSVTLAEMKSERQRGGESRQRQDTCCSVLRLRGTNAATFELAGYVSGLCQPRRG